MPQSKKEYTLFIYYNVSSYGASSKLFSCEISASSFEELFKKSGRVAYKLFSGWPDAQYCYSKICVSTGACYDLSEESFKQYIQEVISAENNEAAKRRYRPIRSGYKRRGGRYYRRIGTTPEKRMNQIVDECEKEFKCVARTKRSKGLPSSWDDYPVRCRDNDNWKRYRKTQYKPK